MIILIICIYYFRYHRPPRPSIKKIPKRVQKNATAEDINPINSQMRGIIQSTIKRSGQKQYIINLHKRIFQPHSQLSQQMDCKMQVMKNHFQQFYPELSIRSIIVQLYKFVLGKYDISPKDRHLAAMCIPQLYFRFKMGKKVLIKRRSRADLGWAYDYLHNKKLPQMPRKTWKNESNLPAYFDYCVILIPQQKNDQYWKIQERRFMADVFTRIGYGVNYFRAQLGEPSCMEKDRFKSTMNNVVKNSIRSIQDFLRDRLKAKITPLRQLVGRFIPNPLLNCRKYFEPNLVRTFLRCLRVNYSLCTEPATSDEVLIFYNQYISVMMKQFSPKPFFPDQDQDKIHVNCPVQQRQIWTPQMDKFLIVRYLQGKTVLQIKQEMDQTYPPQICTQFFDNLKIRYRLFKIHRATMRKLNQLIIDNGLSSVDIVDSQAIIKKLMRSPQAYGIRLKLCQLYLDEQKPANFVAELYRDIVNYRNGIYEIVKGQKMGGKIMNNSWDEDSQIPVPRKRGRPRLNRNNQKIQVKSPFLIIQDDDQTVDVDQSIKSQNQIQQFLNFEGFDNEIALQDMDGQLIDQQILEAANQMNFE